jgi:hypothetical protein
VMREELLGEAVRLERVRIDGPHRLGIAANRS